MIIFAWSASSSGNVFATVTGASALVDISGPLPSHYITRVVLSPTNPDVAYVAFNGYGLAPGQQVWKTTNLVSALIPENAYLKFSWLRDSGCFSERPSDRS